MSYTWLMGKCYSEDFRLRVLARLDSGQSKMAAHRIFGVSRSTLDDWLRLRDEQGHVRDKPHVPGRRGALSDPEVFGEFASRHQGATLGQMAAAWHQEKGQSLSINTFSLALQALGWTRKKRVSFIKSGARKSAESSRSNSSKFPPNSECI
jgi:transposase